MLKLKPSAGGRLAIYDWETDTLTIDRNYLQISTKLAYYRFKDKLYEKEQGRLFQIKGQQIEPKQILSTTHRAYLNCLIDKAGGVAGFDELSQLEGKHVNNNTVSKHIGKIKRLLGCEIDNVPRQGYKFHELPCEVDIRRFEQKVTVAKPHWQPLFWLFIALCIASILWQATKLTQSKFKLIQSKATMMQGSEYHGTISPNGRYLAFEYKSSPEQLTHLWLKDLKTGAKTQLTRAQNGIEDEFSAFSADGMRLLFHRTDENSQCSINELVFDSLDGPTFSEQKLFDCHQGYKSINAEYGEDHHTIYFTDFDKFEDGHQVFRFDRHNGEISPVFSLNNSGQGIYRVYPLPQRNELILLSTNDWLSSRVHLLNLVDNKLQHLFDVPQIVKSMGVDRQKRQLYFLNSPQTLSRYTLDDGAIDHFELPAEHDGFVSFSSMQNAVTIDGKTVQSKKIVKLKNPLKFAGHHITDEITSSGSDNLPLVCQQWVYFFSDRTGQYRLWRKHQAQNRVEQVLASDFSGLPEAYDLNRSCQKLALVDARGQLHIVDLDNQQQVYHSQGTVIINAAWRNLDTLIVTLQKDGYRLALLNLKQQVMNEIAILPQSKTFTLAKSNSQLWLLGHQNNLLMTYDFASGKRVQPGYALAVFRNSSWFNWQDNGIYYYQDNEINPVWRYMDLSDGKSATIVLPKSFKNGHFGMAKDDDDSVWMVENKYPQRDVYMYQLIEK